MLWTETRGRAHARGAAWGFQGHARVVWVPWVVGLNWPRPQQGHICAK